MGIMVSTFMCLPGAGGRIVSIGATPEDKHGLPAVLPSASCNCSKENNSPCCRLMVTAPSDDNSHQSETVLDDSKDSGDESALQSQTKALSMSDTFYTISFQISGSTWDNVYQMGLRECKKQLASNTCVKITFTLEHENPVDKNAIRVDFNGKPLGYVGKLHIPRVFRAIKYGEITQASLVQVFHTWAPSGQKYLRGKLVVTKTGKWNKETPEYNYNDVLNC